MSRALFVVLLAVVVLAITIEACSRHHEVATGDTCWKIWTDNGLGEDRFRSLNPGINCGALWIGSKVCIG